MIDQVIYDILTTDATVSGLVGTNVYPAIAPQATSLPYITYQQISSIPYRHLGGVSAFSKSQFQIDCWAATPLAAKTLGNAVQEALDAFHGSQSGIRIGEIALNDRRDNFQPPTDGSDLIVPGVSLDFTILHGD